MLVETFVLNPHFSELAMRSIVLLRLILGIFGLISIWGLVSMVVLDVQLAEAVILFLVLLEWHDQQRLSRKYIYLTVLSFTSFFPTSNRNK